MTVWDTDGDGDLTGRTRGPSLIIWLVAAAVVLFLVWASFASLDEIVRAEGEVVSESRPQIVQNLEGGILAELLVAEGDQVEPGQILARLQGTQFQAKVEDLRGRLAAAEVRRLRFEAEMAGQDEFIVPVDLAGMAANIVQSEQALLVARLADYQSRVAGAQAIVTETQRELETMEDLYAREIAALIEVTRARKANSDAEARLAEIVTGTELERASDYSVTLQEISTLRQDMRLAEDQLARTIITSPMRGVVNNLGVTTIGGVIRPGEEIFQIIPLGDALYVEARVKPADIANVRAGQQATVKLSAYDYTIYGTFPAEVTFISADTFQDERRSDLPPHYRVTLRVDMGHLTERQQGIEMRPGMQATVELHTGEKTVLDYLTRPLYRGSEALREP
jgi:adhesin transport system membrane fusion protein